MGKVLLPYAEPMYSTYHELASAGIPVKQNKTSDNWYYNNTVDWNCNRTFLSGLTTPEINLNSGNMWYMPFLEKSGISTQFARRCVLDIIKTMLDDGFYVSFGGVDDYFVKGKSWYQERHYNHDGLIIGYDDEKETFSIAAYDQRWIFTVFETPQNCFAEGMKAMCDQGIYSAIHALKVTDDIQVLDLSNIYNQLKTYLASNLSTYPLDSPGFVHGVMVYDYLCMYLDKLADGSIPYERKDRRIFRLVWEHKKCMLERIRAVEQECGWENRLSASYEEVVKLSDQARFIYSKFVLKYSSTNLERIQVLLMQIKKLESELLSEFLKGLEQELETETLP